MLLWARTADRPQVPDFTQPKAPTPRQSCSFLSNSLAGTAFTPLPAFFSSGTSFHDSTADKEQKDLEKSTKGRRHQSAFLHLHSPPAPVPKPASDTPLTSQAWGGLTDHQGSPELHVPPLGSFKGSPATNHLFPIRSGSLSPTCHREASVPSSLGFWVTLAQGAGPPLGRHPSPMGSL